MTEVDVPYPKAWFAYQMRMQGLDYREIAHRCEYTSANAVVMDIKRHMAENAQQMAAEDREDILTLELDRLNYMLSKIWPQIEHGDLRSVETALKIINQRVKLVGLDAVDASQSVQTVLVVGGEEKDYIQQLKKAAGEIEQ